MRLSHLFKEILKDRLHTLIALEENETNKKIYQDSLNRILREIKIKY